MNDTRIGETARLAGVGVETIRFYQRRGLIEQPPKPRSGGFRAYPDETVERIRFIRRSQGLGFSLGEIGELLSLRTDPATDCADVRELASSKLAEVEEKIAGLETMGSALRSLIDACPGRGAVRACSILDALDRPGCAGPAGRRGIGELTAKGETG